MSAPNAERLGPAVLLRGQGVLDVRALLELGLKTAARDGIGASPRIVELRLVLDAAAAEVMSAPGHADVRSEPDSRSWSKEEVLTTEEAAQMLTISTRHVRRLARDGELEGHQRRDRTWIFTRASIDAYDHRRTA